ncbi:hypothetical protein LCGC14_1604820 [marine sediment metagenome]|uniref:Uncharacterized protein n=1 Tax=marine sediment metagenome TaxID=412755 RepID=A0A0F9KQU3_9ZZZZ
MEKAKTTGIKNDSVLNHERLNPTEKNGVLVKKIDSLWENSYPNGRNSKRETKKLLIKLETTGTEKRKISLKLESSSSNIDSNNYNLLSELLKEFFKVNNAKPNNFPLD